MTKHTSYFQKFFNLCALLFLTIILSIVCTICLRFGMNAIQEIAYLIFVYRSIKLLFCISLLTSLISSILFILLISHEIKSRQEEDSLSNLWQSIKQTLAIRVFLHQSEHSEALTITEQAKVTHYNPVNKHFNKAVNKAIIEVRKDTIILMIHLPNTQQAKKILDDMRTMVIEEVARHNPDFIFSRFETDKKCTYLLGTKRH